MVKGFLSEVTLLAANVPPLFLMTKLAYLSDLIRLQPRKHESENLTRRHLYWILTRAVKMDYQQKTHKSLKIKRA